MYFIDHLVLAFFLGVEVFLIVFWGKEELFPCKEEEKETVGYWETGQRHFFVKRQLE